MRMSNWAKSVISSSPEVKYCLYKYRKKKLKPGHASKKRKA
jgi:hypothetical protein